MKKKIIKIITIFIAVIVALFIGFGIFINANYPTQKLEANNLIPVTVERVIDGDTLIVINNDGKEERVRLIGIDTPESVNPDESKNSEEGIKASEFTKSLIKNGQVVYLQYDEEKTDKYDRTLAYVWLKEDISTVPTLNEISDYMLNGIILSEGYATTLEIEPNTEYAFRFQIIEMKAKADSKGLWNNSEIKN